MRDLETVEAALKIAETGHLTFGTLHTNSAAQTINRIIDIFPAEPAGADPDAAVARARRASSARRCCRGPTARAASCSLEIMVPTPAIRNLIRDDKIHQIYGSMQTGQEKLGMQTANQSLASLYMKRLITLETAMTASSNKDELQDMINRGVGVVAGAGLGRTAGHARPAPRDRPVRRAKPYADFCIFRTDARRADGQRRAGRRHDGRGGRRAAARADHRHADHAGQGEGRRRRQEGKGGQDRQEGRRPRTWRSSRASSR